MAEIKTKRNDQSVTDFINHVPEERKRKDSFTILELMQSITREEPKMWGDAIVGFGCYHYRYESGHEGDMPLVAFSPRKQSLTLYITRDFERYPELIQRLGKHSTSKACLYIKKLADVDMAVLEDLLRESFETMARKTSQA